MSEPQPCVLCGATGAVGIGDRWFCLDHADAGFAEAGQAVTDALRAITEEGDDA